MNFKEYLKTKKLSEASEDKYFKALSRVIKENSYDVMKKMSIKELNELLLLVKNSGYDIKGQKMYSTALSHYIDFYNSKLEIKSPKKINKFHNRIIYGAPGTGKSYQLNEEVKNLFNILKKGIQIEGLKNNRNYWIVGAKWEDLDKTKEFIEKNYWENGYDDKYQDKVNSIKEGDYIGIKAAFTRKKDNETIGCLRIKALGIVIKNYKNGKRIDVKWNITEVKDYDNICYMTTIHKVQDRHLKIFDSINQKSIKIGTIIPKINLVNRVTFYDGYTHGQFVGTYKPVPEGDSITYRYIPGPFMKQLVESYKNPNHNFCLIIEEINRAKADRVFGNIFQLLDRDSARNSEYHIAVSADQETYLREELGVDYSETLEKLLNEGLYIPNNLYIWATMNSADQGVYPMDSAFKRRWHFEHIGLDQNEDEFGEEGKTYGLAYQQESEAEGIENKIIPWNDFRRIINENLLGNKVSEDRLLAPFFIKENNFQLKEDDFFELDGEVFKNKILMYLFDDVLRHKKKTILFDENIESFSQLKEACEDGKAIFHSTVIEKLDIKEIIKEPKAEIISEEA